MRRQGLLCSSAAHLPVEPITLILTALGLLGGGVTALWRIANSLGRFQGGITKTLEGIDKHLGSINKVLEDHELRLRDIERPEHHAPLR